ncbi:RTA1 like protein-domain-containing protein [Lipomyces oligophaga]|uniref:RTA1 like protein-domain-containing protein n=1 Tax=Lipomyces oligophaga TaxID=45792 RepID=UPI0034CEC6B8
MSDIPPALSGGYQLWYYYPSVPGNIVVAVLFLILCLLHLVYITRKRSLFCIPLLIGGVFEVVGYGCRTYCHYNTDGITVYSIQAVLILVAPVLIAASAYMFLGRIISRIHGESRTVVPRKWLTRIFVTSDVICFFIQGAGAGLLARSDSASQTQNYQKIILAGLVLQIIFFAFFVVVALIFHYRMRNVAYSVEGGIHWQKLLISLYLVSALIILPMSGQSSFLMLFACYWYLLFAFLGTS